MASEDFIPDFSHALASLESVLAVKDYSQVAAVCEELELDFAFVNATGPGPYDPVQSTSSSSDSSMETDEEPADPNAMAITSDSPVASSVFAHAQVRPHDPRIYSIELAALLILNQLPEARALTLRVDGHWPSASTSNSLPSPLRVNGKGSPHHPSTSDYAALRETASALNNLDFERAYHALHARRGQWDASLVIVANDLWTSIQDRAKDLIAAAYDSLTVDRARRWLGFIHPDEPPEIRRPVGPVISTPQRLASTNEPIDPSTPTATGSFTLPPPPTPVEQPARPAPPAAEIAPLIEAAKNFARQAGWDVEEVTEGVQPFPEGGAWILAHASKTVTERSRKAFARKAREAGELVKGKVDGIAAALGLPSGADGGTAEDLAHMEMLTEFVLHLEREPALAA